MVSRHDIRIDVGAPVGLGVSLHTAAWVYIPDSDIDPRNATILFAFPGGTYTRAYYDLQAPGYEGYSFAEHLAKFGHIVVACDHIAIGDSSPYEPFETLTRDIVINADQATVVGVMNQLAAGFLVDGLPPIKNPFTIGVGHSMGGAFLTLLQQRYRSFDAVAILGWSQLPPSNRRAHLSGIVKLCLRGKKNKDIDPRSWPDATRPPREIFHRGFHDEAVPQDLIEADDKLATRIYSFWFEKSRKARTSALREVHNSAQHIDCPIFLGFGERDLTPDPRREVAAYTEAPDVTTFVLLNSAHCFNFSRNRSVFFDRIAGWAHVVSQTYRQQPLNGNPERR